MAARERPGCEPATRAYIGLGSNLAEPLSQISTALEALAELRNTVLIACSGVYRNRAMTDPRAGSPPVPQADYLNAVAAIDTRQGPEDLLQALLDQEAIQGRRRGGGHWEARCIDLDLLLYGELTLNTRHLTLPHPGLHQRPFVIHPLAEIAPRAVIPGYGAAAGVAKIISRKSLTRVHRGSVFAVPSRVTDRAGN